MTIHERREPVIPSLEQRKAQALEPRGNDEQRRAGQERLAHGSSTKPSALIAGCSGIGMLTGPAMTSCDRAVMLGLEPDEVLHQRFTPFVGIDPTQIQHERLRNAEHLHTNQRMRARGLEP